MESQRNERRLNTARRNGFLNANPPRNENVRSAYGLWCWRLRIPMLWYQRESPHSRYSRIYLEMLTTGCVLTPPGLAELEHLLGGAASIYPHAAVSARLAHRDVAALARKLYKAASRPGNSESAGRRAPAVVLAFRARPA